MTAGLALGLPGRVLGAERSSPGTPNSEIRLAIVGLGGINTPGGVGGRGRQLINSLRKVGGNRIVALCDVDKEILEHSVQQFKERQQEVVAYRDLRRVFDDRSIDAVVVATPNHWHGLATVWACQAGKDVYVEKPFSYNIWEGRQMVAAARKYGRIVQVGTQSRSSTVLQEAFEYLRGGQLGAIRYAHALVYRPREGIVKVSEPTPVPATVDYDLWCGPAPKGPLLRKQLHYEWHWFWATGCGEMGNNGIHVIDICRWALGQNRPAPRAMSLGGRFAVQDGAETPNTQIALFDFQPAPLICEVRNVRASQNAPMGKFRNSDKGVVIDCEGGYFAGESSGGTIFDRQGQKIKEFKGSQSQDPEQSHLANFLAAARSRKAKDLKAAALEGHLSTACCHLANISYRLGKTANPEAIQETLRGSREFADAFERCRQYLKENGVDLGATPAVLGPWVSYDAQQEKFVKDFADEANGLSQREYRAPFVVPKIVA
jgi:predicted dehydrogenase